MKSIQTSQQVNKGNYLALEHGKTTTFGMFLCLFALMFYLSIGRASFLQKLPEYYDKWMILFLISLTAFVVAYVLYVILFRDPRTRENRRWAERKVASLEYLNALVDERRGLFESRLSDEGSYLSPKGRSNLRGLANISEALASRAGRVRKLLLTEDEWDLDRATGILKSPFHVGNKEVIPLRGSQTLRRIEVDQLLEVLTDLFWDLEQEMIPSQNGAKGDSA